MFFSAISGLKLNKKKRKAMWISSVKNNETKPLGFKPLGINLSYKHEKDDNLNLFIKICKMDTKLNIWQTRELTLFGRTKLVKTLGLSKLVYAASYMLRVPEMVIKLRYKKK